MDELPDEILPIVAGYLPPSDAIQLNNTCKKLHSKLSLTATSPRQILTKFSRQNSDGDAHYGFQIPVPHQVSCHSMLLSMIWRDQEWGNRKGKVYVVAEEKNHFHGRSGERFGGGRVAYTSGILALHEEERLDIKFQPKENETYHLWYAVGGGGGHGLRLSNVKVQALVFDDPSRCFGKAYNFLTRTDALHAWDQKSMTIVHLDIEQFLLTLGEHLLPPLISFAHGDNVSEANLQLKLRGFVQFLWEYWMEECFVYAKIMAEAPSQREFGWQELHHLDNMQVDDFLEDRMDFGEFIVPED